MSSSWIRYSVNKRIYDEDLQRCYDTAEAFWVSRMKRKMLKSWNRKAIGARRREIMASGLIAHVYDIHLATNVFRSWFALMLEARKARAYFESLELGSHDTDEGTKFSSGNRTEAMIAAAIANVAVESRDVIAEIPQLAQQIIFSYLNPVDVARCGEVNRSWKTIISLLKTNSWLDLSSLSNRLTNKLLSEFLTRQRVHLRLLNLVNSYCITREGFRTVSLCVNLQDLNLSGCLGLTDDAVFKIVKECRLLIFLNLSYTHITDNSLRHLSIYAANLQYLSLAYCFYLTDQGFAYFVPVHTYRNLVHLDISGCKQLTAIAYENLARGVPQVRHWILNHLALLSDKELKLFGEFCPQIETLELRNSGVNSSKSFTDYASKKQTQAILKSSRLMINEIQKERCRNPILEGDTNNEKSLKNSSNMSGTRQNCSVELTKSPQSRKDRLSQRCTLGSLQSFITSTGLSMICRSSLQRLIISGLPEISETALSNLLPSPLVVSQGFNSHPRSAITNSSNMTTKAETSADLPLLRLASASPSSSLSASRTNTYLKTPSGLHTRSLQIPFTPKSGDRSTDLTTSRGRSSGSRKCASEQKLVEKPRQQKTNIYPIKYCQENYQAEARLTHLAVTDCPQFADTALLSLSQLTRLTVLNLSRCPSITDTGLKWITDSAYAPNLRELYLAGCSQLTDASVLMISKRLVKISYLSLEYCLTLTDLSLESLGTCSQLHSLNIGHTKLADNGFSRLGMAPKLRRLNISACIALTDLGLQKYSHLGKYLEQLDLSFCLHITDSGIKTLVLCCRFLKKLNLSGCNQLTDLSIQYLAGVCRSLTYLNVSACTMITEISLRHLKKGCHQLEHLVMLFCKSITKRHVNKLTDHIALVEYSADDPPLMPLSTTQSELNFFNLEGLIDRDEPTVNSQMENSEETTRSSEADDSIARS